MRQVVRNLFSNLEYATTVQWASGLIYCCAEVSVSISAPLKDDCGAKQWFQNWKNPPEIDSLLQFVCCDFTKQFKATFSISVSGGYLLLVFKICQTVAVHSSLLSVFGLNAASTYDSYLPLIFGKFALI